MPWYVSAAVRFQIAVADQLEMPLADVHAVGALVEFGPVGVRRLADLMGMTTGAVTDGRPAGTGWLRTPGARSERPKSVVLRAVPERVGVISRYYQSMGDRWQRQIEGFSDAELRFLVEFLRRGRENTQVETARLRAEGARTARGDDAHSARRRPEAASAEP